MFNRSYQMRAVKNAGGGHQVAEAFYRPKRRVRPGIAADQCKKRSGELQGVQLELFAAPEPQYKKNPIFPVPARNGRQSPADLKFPPLAPIEAADDDQPLADLFPEAYL
jgi:hypothetical protein